MPFMSGLSTFTWSKESFWTTSSFMLIKNLMLTVNFLSMLAGIILIGGGAYLGTLAGHSGAGLINLGGTISTAAIAIGVIVTIVSFLGCAGSANEKGMLLKTYFALLIILVILEVSVGIAAYAKRNSIEDGLEAAWTAAYATGNSTLGHRALIQVEDTFDCCGYANVTDMAVPEDCATFFGYTEGCKAAVKGGLNGSFGAIGGAGLVIGLIEIIGLIGSAVLFKKISQREAAAGSLLNESWRINRNKISYGAQNYSYV
ncbi:Leukocyte surface antigen cd53 [Thoreauomyces humboldtii]|nr:Leukocyte surface antigen cd53 [Thoreauomyces humboldtii]